MMSNKHPHPSRLKEILESSHEKLHRIDELERRLDERVIKLRRRACNILDSQTSAHPHRASHLRCFVTHSCHKNSISDASVVTGATGTSAATVYGENVKKIWVLRVEGRLLIGHLDHESAAQQDAKTGYVTPADELDRAKGGKEEEEDVLPVQFTHFFERVIVEFQTTYSPKPHPMAKPKVTEPSPATKKRRSAGNKQTATLGEDEIDPKTLAVSEVQTMLWTKASSGDAHAFDFEYEAPAPAESRYQLHSVVAKVQLFPYQSPAAKESTYDITPELARQFFPQHVPPHDLEVPPETPGGSENASKKCKQDESGSSTPPTEDELYVPEGLTMQQISMAFFNYIRDRDLGDEEDKSTIHCDEKLKELFQVEQFNFSTLQQLLVSKNLIRSMNENPVKITQILKEETSTNYQPPSGTNMDDENAPVPSHLQFDMSIFVPAFFPYRVREILRRVKRRELEYTSARPKAARNLVQSQPPRTASESKVKAAIDQVVVTQHLGVEYIPILLALAHGALPGTEARTTAQIDAQLSYLLSKVQEHVEGAKKAWKRVQDNLPPGFLESPEDKGIGSNDEDGVGEKAPDTLSLCPAYILTFLKERLGQDPAEVQEAKSAQQCVLILRYDKELSKEVSQEWQNALECGRNHLVVRYWKGGSRWWNLNQKSPESSYNLACAERAAYQVARMALGGKIPRMLHSEFEYPSSAEGSHLPWAVLEYVGPESKRFQTLEAAENWKYDSSWKDLMIKTRDEFGFPEPHPRWGRVPCDRSQAYAMTVLQEVTIPLHEWFLQQRSSNKDFKLSSENRAALVKEASADPQEKLEGCAFKSLVQKVRLAYSEMELFAGQISKNSPKDANLAESIQIFQQCLEQLEQEVNTNEALEPLPFVLVHMDCQPQNLIFGQKTDQDNENVHVMSVLDWEEAAFADPRFELLLLGRKVCANAQQAEHIWQTYQQAFPDWNLGSLDPWLRLETVHSLCTLLLQSMDHTRYGRSPWETRPDLSDKITREFQRLGRAGWTFCDAISSLPK